MTLHEAILVVLKKADKSMTTQQIANELNRKKLYQKRDGSKITAFQVHGRTRNYPKLFSRNGNLVSLQGQKIVSVKKPEQIVEKENMVFPRQAEKDIALQKLEKHLLAEEKYTLAKKIDNRVPGVPGVYCFRMKNPDNLPSPFNEILKRRVIYIGIAGTSLNRRMLNQELRANGHGTFFRSIGAVLGYCPPFNSLKNKKNKRNYQFSTEDEEKIIKWINENLLVNWVVTKQFKELETFLIKKYKPLLNLNKNPVRLNQLSALRKKCVEVASGEK